MSRPTPRSGRIALVAAAVWLAAPAAPAAAMPDPPEPGPMPHPVRTVSVEVPVEVPVEDPTAVSMTAEVIRIGVAALLGAALTATVAGPGRMRRRRPEAGAHELSAADDRSRPGAGSGGREPEVIAHNWPDVAPW